jgi:hypothetical protein
MSWPPAIATARTLEKKLLLSLPVKTEYVGTLSPLLCLISHFLLSDGGKYTSEIFTQSTFGWVWYDVILKLEFDSSRKHLKTLCGFVSWYAGATSSEESNRAVFVDFDWCRQQVRGVSAESAGAVPLKSEVEMEMEMGMEEIENERRCVWVCKLYLLRKIYSHKEFHFFDQRPL